MLDPVANLPFFKEFSGHATPLSALCFPAGDDIGPVRRAVTNGAGRPAEAWRRRTVPHAAAFLIGTARFHMWVLARLLKRNHGRETGIRSEEHTSELQSLMRISYAVFCLKKKKTRKH